MFAPFSRQLPQLFGSNLYHGDTPEVLTNGSPKIFSPLK